MTPSVGWRRLLEVIRLPPEVRVLAIGAPASDPLAAGLPLREIEVPGLDPQWWICLQPAQ